jgi:hypothetical protein
VKRSLILTPFLLLAACSGGGEAPKTDEQAAETIEAGLWEVSSETTAFRSTDKTAPAVKAAVGDKASFQACVGEAETAKPAPALFAGEGYECQYKNSYMRGGRLNIGLECTRAGVKGSIPMLVEGTYKATTFEASVKTDTYFPGDGDFTMTRKLNGRKAAAGCPAAPTDGTGSSAAAQPTSGQSGIREG